MWFLLGLLLGSVIGLLVAGLCVAASRGGDESGIETRPFGYGGGSAGDPQRTAAPEVSRDDEDMRRAA